MTLRETLRTMPRAELVGMAVCVPLGLAVFVMIAAVLP